MILFLRYVILIFIVLLPARSVVAGDEWRDYLQNDWQRLGSALNARTALIAGGWLAGMYLLSDYDEQINASAGALYRGNWQAYFNTIDHLGNVPYTIPVSVGLTGLTLLGNDKRLQDAAFTSTEALITTGMAVAVIKLIIGRTRPDDGEGSRNFRPFSGNYSFPSGHAATAFALVTPWLYYYPNPFTYLLLVLPASTAISRMVLDRHWFTDVLTGSVMGFLIGSTLARWHKDLARQNEQIAPFHKPVMLFSYSVSL